GEIYGSSGSSRKISGSSTRMQDFSNFSSFPLYVISLSVLILSCMSVSSMGREQERRTKQKMDHPSLSSSPGSRKNYKRSAQRLKPPSVSGTSQGRPASRVLHQISPDGSDGYWTFEFALTPEQNPDT